jgi:perosamine synthetase
MKKRQISIAFSITGENEWQTVREPIMSGWLMPSPKVAELEKQFGSVTK